MFAHSLNVKQFYLTLLGATTLSQSGHESDGNKCVLRIPQSSSITVASPSDCLVRPEFSLMGSYTSTGMQSVYSTFPADWAVKNLVIQTIVVVSALYLEDFARQSPL